jgi:LuxR family transcriptional regulator, maltose regulon positive regulatory protein
MPTGPAATLASRRSLTGQIPVKAWRDTALLDEGSRVSAFHDGFVRRTPLVRRLVDARDASLALIVAPAGYGKSSLLHEWAEQDERAFAWLRLDESDQDPVTLVRSLGLRDRSFVVVLDDAHLIAAGTLRALVIAVLKELPPGSILALASRTEPALPTGRLRAHRALVEVRTQDLAMTPAEAAILLRRAGLELELSAVRTLASRTEGWPAALYLAALSLREQRDAQLGLSGYAGDDHLLCEYFRDEFLAGLQPDMTRFLIRTSVLDHLSGPVCDAVLQRTGSALTLSQLARSNLLLRPVDPSHERYRWHGLFRDALKAELRRSEPQVETRLQRRASAWHTRHGDIDRAIDHAVAAGDVGRTGDLLWANIVGYVTHGRNDLVERWLSRFRRDQIADYAPLALAAAHSCLAMGSVDQAQHWALAASGARERGRAAEDTESLSTGITIVEALALRTGAIDMGAAAASAYEREADDSPWRPICCLLRGAAEHLTGDRIAARQLLEEGVQLGGVAAPSIASLCLAQLVIIAIEQEDWDAAAELADRAADVVQQNGLAESPLSALVLAASAAARARQGRADEAKRDLRDGADLLATLGDFIPWYGAQARILLARASLWLADIVGARTLLAEASRLARRSPDVVIFQQWFDEAWAHIDTLAETALAGPSSLSIAELRILRFLPSHRSFREIAQQLGVSANTVKTQAHAIYRKLDAASRSEAVERARDAGLLGH